MTYITGTVHGPAASQEITFLIDSGAMYSLLPEAVWRAIGLKADRTQAFRLADGSVIERNVGEARIELPQGAAWTSVILGQPKDPEPLLGVVTLENMGMVFDPFERTIHPMRMLMMRLG